jgi:hypothetical protein
LPWLAVVGLALLAAAAAAVLVMAVARRPAAPPSVVEALPRLEAEVEAAKGTGLYLVLDPEGKGLAVKARGKTLDTAPLVDVRVELHRPAGELREGSAIGLWTVEVEPEGEYRLVIAPQELRPYQEEEETEAPATGTPPEVLPDPPSSYTVGLDSGWELVVVQELPPDTAWSRFRQALAEGWARARQWRRPLRRPDRLLLLTTPEQGSRLHHLFRKGTPIVLAREPFAAPLPPAAAEPVPAAGRRDKDAPVGS